MYLEQDGGLLIFFSPIGVSSADTVRNVYKLQVPPGRHLRVYKQRATHLPPVTALLSLNIWKHFYKLSLIVTVVPAWDDGGEGGDYERESPGVIKAVVCGSKVTSS